MSPSRRIHAALERARSRPARCDVADERARPRRIAMGDPQAPLPQVLAVLDHHGLLGDDGALADDVQLVSMGDHFDWGRPGDRAQAADDGAAFLSWLAHHPPNQAIILCGNHDLVRVGELFDYDDARFASALALADGAYHAEPRSPAHERALRAEHPRFASAEVVARDFCTFRDAQRTLVDDLLGARGTPRRLQLAWAPHPRALFTHAGVTLDELAAIGVAEGSDAVAIAAALNRALDDAVAARARSGGPLVIAHLHRPGDGDSEGEGMLYHRPTALPNESHYTDKPPPRRRFRPRRLPRDVVQVIGHIRDGKVRELLRTDPAQPKPAGTNGPLRHMLVDTSVDAPADAHGAGVSHALGLPARVPATHAAIVFTDGGMSTTPAASYQVLEWRALLPVLDDTSTSNPQDHG